MISSIGSNSGYASMSSMGNTREMKRPDPAKMAENLFSQLDTKGQGYIEKSDLQSAFDSIASSSASTSSSGATNVDDVFSQLDSDSDGKVTKDELSSALKNIADQLDTQFNAMRMSGAGGQGGPGGPGGPGGMAPPPPPEGQEGEDNGLTQDQLTDMAEKIGSTDTQRAELMKNLAANFDEADADSDGKVTRKEAMSYEEAGKTSATNSTTNSTDSSASSTSATATSNGDATVMMRIMQLIHAYGGSGQSASTNVLSTSA